MGEGINEKAMNTSNPLGEEVRIEVAMPKSFKIKICLEALTKFLT